MSTQTLPAQSFLPSQTIEFARIKRKISFEVIALTFIIILCALLRFYHLGAASLWSDEIFSRYYVDLFGLHYVLADGLSKETNPPTYYLLLRGWISLFGDSDRMDGRAALFDCREAALDRWTGSLCCLGEPGCCVRNRLVLPNDKTEQ